MAYKGGGWPGQPFKSPSRTRRIPRGNNYRLDLRNNQNITKLKLHESSAHHTNINFTPSKYPYPSRPSSPQHPLQNSPNFDPLISQNTKYLQTVPTSLGPKLYPFSRPLFLLAAPGGTLDVGVEGRSPPFSTTRALGSSDFSPFFLPIREASPRRRHILDCCGLVGANWKVWKWKSRRIEPFALFAGRDNWNDFQMWCWICIWFRCKRPERLRELECSKSTRRNGRIYMPRNSSGGNADIGCLREEAKIMTSSLSRRILVSYSRIRFACWCLDRGWVARKAPFTNSLLV